MMMMMMKVPCGVDKSENDRLDIYSLCTVDAEATPRYARPRLTQIS
jgi:hypothetical protein